MGTFSSQKTIPATVSDLTVVAADVERHFADQDYQIEKSQTVIGGWIIDIHKGGMFKSVLGMKTAMKIEIEPAGAFTIVKAGIGLLGLQAVPFAVSMFVFWPVLLTQLWGLVQTARLDEEAIAVAERSLLAHSGTTLARPPGAANDSASVACANCGATLPDAVRFCPHCGKPVV